MKNKNETLEIKEEFIIDKKLDKKSYINQENKKIEQRGEIVGNILKFLRKRFDFSQKEIAQKIGVAQQTYAGYETGKHEPSIEIIIRLADIYNVPLNYITGRFHGTNPEKEEEEEYITTEEFLDNTIDYYLTQRQQEKEFLKILTQKKQ